MREQFRRIQRKTQHKALQEFARLAWEVGIYPANQ
jgi:hypothetical protein